ncbi:B-Cell Cll/Lymphoma 6 Member B Protein [Manis pentadactyla]|nr:B-Cell Cll/Lymphoma 6 Member B Protein [Manis pentadactyla]
MTSLVLRIHRAEHQLPCGQSVTLLRDLQEAMAEMWVPFGRRPSPCHPASWHSPHCPGSLTPVHAYLKAGTDSLQDTQLLLKQLFPPLLN